MTRALLSLGLLTLVYALVLGSVHPLDLAAGVAVSAIVVASLRPFLFVGPSSRLRELPRRTVAFLVLCAVVVRDIVVGTWQVALVVLHLRPLSSPGIVAIPIEERTRRGVAVSALLSTLSPGEFLVDVDWERRVMLVHVLDGRDPDTVRERHRHFYRRWQRRVFP